MKSFSAFKGFALFVMTITIAGCKSDFYIDVYSSDLFLNENVDTPAQMMVQIPTCSDRSEYEKSVLALFDSASKAKIVGCEEQGMDSMLVVSIAAEISTENSSRDVILFRQDADDVEQDGQTYEVRGLKPLISPNFLARVNSLMQENMQSLSYEKITIRFSLNNDEREEVLITSSNLWVNGDPYQRYYRQELGRREKIELVFSNVISDLVIRGEQPLAVYVYRKRG